MSDEPEERHATARQALRAALGGAPQSVRELSALTGLSEKEIPEHLEHLERTLRGEGLKLTVLPPRCVRCGFRFEERERLRKPSRCPRCKSERIEPARFTLAD